MGRDKNVGLQTPPVEHRCCKECGYLESLKDPLEEDVVGVVDLRLLCYVLNLHLCLLLLLTGLCLLLLCLLLLLLGSLLLTPLLTVSAPAIFLANKMVCEFKEKKKDSNTI